MRRILPPLCLFCVGAFAQSSDPQWRQDLMNLPSQPGAAAPQELCRLQQDLRLATPYFAALRPGDYDANYELIRRMVAYLAGVELLTRDPQLRVAVNQAYLGIASLRWAGAYARLATLSFGIGCDGTSEGPPTAEASPRMPPLPQPPFALAAPEVANVAPADRNKLIDLQTHYELASTRAASTWTSAASLRQRLEGQGMALNPAIEASLARLQLYFELAAGALRSKDWAEAQLNLERAEITTENLRKSVGR